MSNYQANLSPIQLIKDGLELVKDQFWLFLGITIVGFIIGEVSFGICAGAMLCGIFLCYFKKMNGDAVTFDLLFKGFDYFVEGLIAILIIAVCCMVIVIPFWILLFLIGMVLGSDGGAIVGVLALLFYVILAVLILAIYALTAFTFPLIVDRNMKAMAAIKLSISAGKANLVPLILLFLLLGILTGIGTVLCVIPGLCMYPISFGAIAIAYRQVFGDGHSASGSAPPPPPA